MGELKGCSGFVAWVGIILGVVVVVLAVTVGNQPSASSRDPTPTTPRYSVPATRTPVSSSHSRNLRPSKSVVSDSESVAATPTAVPPTFQVDVQVANVRSGPSTDLSIVGTAGQGEEFVVMGKNLEGNWLQIKYHGRTGWIFWNLGTVTGSSPVSVAANIPATPSANRPSSPTRVRVTPITTRRTAARCTFADTEPRVPDPINLAVYDCEAWSIAYYLLFHDRPEVIFASYDNEERIDLTFFVFNFLRKATINCSTSPTEVASLAMIAGERLEENASKVPDELLLAPRTAILALLEQTTGTYVQCTALIAGFLDGLLN